jgi:hypothetical protein
MGRERNLSIKEDLKLGIAEDLEPEQKFRALSVFSAYRQVKSAMMSTAQTSETGTQGQPWKSLFTNPGRRQEMI